MAHAKSFGTVWRASDSFNVVRLTPERRERADRQRALVSAYRLEVRVVGLEDRNKTQGAGRRAVADFAVGSGGGLGEMTRRKREIVGLTNERDFPHLVELALPPGGFRSVFLELDAFHREQRIPLRRGRSREAEQLYIRFCFPDPATADAFRNRFGGERLTCAAPKPQRTSRA